MYKSGSARTQARLLPTFVVFLCLFSAAAYALILHSHHQTAPLSRFLMWCPGAAAIVTCLLLRSSVARLGFAWPAKRFICISYFPSIDLRNACICAHLDHHSGLIRTEAL